MSQLKHCGFLAVFLALLIFGGPMASAKIKMMRITPAKEKIQINHYRITDVVDERLDKSNYIGYLSTGAHNYFLRAEFHQTLREEITRFLDESTVQKGSAEAVVLHVYDYLLYEKSSFKGAEIALNTHYALFNKDGHRLLDYVITDTRNTGMFMSVNAGELLCRNLTSYLSEMDQKIDPFLAMYKSNQPIKVSYIFVKEPEQKNLLPYNPQHPLNIYHFVAKAPEQGTEPSAAECGLMINYQIRHFEGKAEAFIELLPYFDQARSWLRPGQDVKKRLAYEQTYFKISAFITNELIKELQEKSFTFNTLKPDIDALREKYVSRMKALQQEYIKETEYGDNVASMEKWSRKVAFYPASTPQ
ncbi:hypothetical protein [Taibaiella koreensis]|uniref:hypothetical protein n=1 Tax=Taibaiella koreensis TaxID=1268548 RepID=UPI000E59EC9E|nr:hypothetical protein [Taibaiella koreensis]